MKFLQAMIKETVNRASVENSGRFSAYQFDPIAYIRDFHRGTPWKGVEGADGQFEILQDYALCIKKQWEKQQYELDKSFPLTCYEPGERIKNWLRIEAGHGVGKTRLAAWMVSHFFDCFNPSVTYAYAPTFPQINDLLFKEIRADRNGRDDLPGKVLKRPEITTHEGDHFVKGRATSGQKTEAIQGQHIDYQLFILDEAEGLPSILWDAIKAMTTGGINVVVMLANPRTRTSEFYRCANYGYVKSYRLSCLWFPNVYHGNNMVPNGTTRDYVDDMIDLHCIPVDKHDPDRFTFSVHWRKSTIYLPNGEFLFRVMGVAPLVSSYDTFAPVGRFEQAMNGSAAPGGKVATIGVDAARYGGDKGTIYCRHGDYVWLHDEIEKEDGYEYYISILRLISSLREAGVTEIFIRVDGGGGYGSTIIDNLSHNDDLYQGLDEFIVSEVHFNGVPYDTDNFADKVTEMYYHAGECLHGITLGDHAPSLQDDLCFRRFKNVVKRGRDVKKLRSKEEFKAEYKRSPDHGDGFALAVGPQRIFTSLSEIGFG